MRSASGTRAALLSGSDALRRRRVVLRSFFLRHGDFVLFLQLLLSRVLAAPSVPLQRVARNEHKGQAAEVDEENVGAGQRLVQPAELQTCFLAFV